MKRPTYRAFVADIVLFIFLLGSLASMSERVKRGVQQLFWAPTHPSMT